MQSYLTHCTNGRDVMAGVCGCRGVRSCRLCEDGKTRKLGRPHHTDALSTSLYQCHKCGQAGLTRDCPEDASLPPLHACREPCGATGVLRSAGIATEQLDPPLDGVTVVKEFLSPEDELSLVTAIDHQTWANSQSGRRKQVDKTHTLTRTLHYTHPHSVLLTLHPYTGLWSKSELQTS